MSVVASGAMAAGLERFPERDDPREHWLDAIERVVTAPPRMVLQTLRRRRQNSVLTRTNRLEPEFSALTDEELKDRGRQLRVRMRLAGLAPDLLPGLFALVREVSRRSIGLRHHDVQILAGLAMLNGAVTEMDTGEGKTLTATLTVAAAAFAGIPVHVVTVNEYLAVRDLETLDPIYHFLGLTTGVVTNELTPAERAGIYGRDVVYASNKEIAFDYLRDRIALGRQPSELRMKLHGLLGEGGGQERAVMRGLHFAIVDEADSVLVDEARTPLIISQETNAEDEGHWADQAFQIIEGFEEGRHYRVLAEQRRIELTDPGLATLKERGEALGDIWENHVRRDETARQALSANLLFRRGEHYLVTEGKVQIIDEYTGRVMPDRSWSDGLHQLIEHKEDCEITSRKNPLARMTYQRFFRRYLRLAGMTGTAHEVRGELWSVYRLMVRRIPPNQPSRRTRLEPEICNSEEDKWRRIVELTGQLVAQGRPVLVGTRSVIASETVSERLTEAGFDHVVLNAEQSEQEAEIIAEAGLPGRITVATNMAGRGVDIAIDPLVNERGGLHVILSERHDAGRIDRQMEGRTARRGEPGTTQAIVSLEDPLLELLPSPFLHTLSLRGGDLGHRCGLLLFALAQRRAERAHGRDRKNLLAQDRRLGTLLAFSGRQE